ncbi:MAG TPA: hypothetical protein VET90_09920, partial [Candidatus Binatus sp.]|nr:hypothetical protein [Candidatus Binatus sp.]
RLLRGEPRWGPARTAAQAGIAMLLVLAVGGGIVLAGTPARGTVVPDATELLHRLPTGVDPATLPAVTVGQDVVTFDPTLVGDGMREVVVSLAQNLEIENLALLRRDATILPSVDHGDRLVQMQALVAQAQASGTTVVEHYHFDAISVSVLFPFGRQSGPSLGLHATGTVVRETRDASGALASSSQQTFDLVFAMRRATGARWLDVAVLPPDGVPPGSSAAPAP